MSTADPFLPIQDSDGEFDETAGAEPGPFPGDADSEPDVLPHNAADDAGTGADEPPVTETTLFRTPSGQSVDPADD
jgi:hypothetical protein